MHEQHDFDQVAGWTVDLQAHEISRAGLVRRLEPKVARVLGLLLAHRGQVVRRDALLEHAWPGMVVGDDAVTNTIIKLRRALGDTSRVARIIETVPRSGYRLRADSGAASCGPHTLAAPCIDGWDHALASAQRIVVRVETAAGGDRVADVLDAALGAELARCPWLSIVLTPDSACHFRCRATLAGTGDRAQLIVQLIDARRGTIEWSTRLPFACARIEAIASHITGRVEGVLLSSPEWLGGADDSALSEPLGWVLRGIRHMNSLTLQGNAAAQRSFQRAIALDGRYARAHACLAWCLRRKVQMHGRGAVTTDMSEATAAARRAFALAPTDPFVLVHVGAVAAYIENELRIGLDLVALSLERDPNFVRVWAAAAEFAALAGDNEHAAEHAQRALDAAPGDPSLWVSLTALARARYAQGAYDEALELARGALWRNRFHEPARLVLAAAQAGAGTANDARRTLAPLLEANTSLDARTLRARYAPQRIDNLPRLIPHLVEAGLRIG